MKLKKFVSIITLSTMLLTGNLFASDVSFLNTGNSDCILIQDEGINILIDGADNNDEASIEKYLRDKKVEKLDYIVVSHSDADHIGGLDYIISKFKVGKIFVGNSKSETKAYDSFIQACKTKGITPVKPDEKEIKITEDSYIKFYNQDSKEKTTNDMSLVMHYKDGENDFLFTGDISSKVEEGLKIGDIEVLKVAHHGSKTSTSQEFLNSTKPEIGVICTGKNSYEHPNPETVSRLKNIKTYRTDKSGNTIISSDGKKLTVKEEFISK